MTKKYRVKDIARLAGVSPGTVDRVIHNRGDVSPVSREKVEAVLASINYQPNLYLSSIGIKKKYTLYAVLPEFVKGEYWEQIEQGVRQALFEFSNIQIKTKFFYYDHFDLYSCRKVFSEASEANCDAMIIGPTFHDETMHFTNTLSNKGIPYVFVDTHVDNTDPIAFFGPHPYMCGYTQAKMLHLMCDPEKEIAIFQAARIGNESSTQTIARKYGFLSYLRERDLRIPIKFGTYYNQDIEESWKGMDRFFEENPNVGGAAIFNSRAYILGGYLKSKRRNDISLVGCSTIERNVKFLKEGYISCLLAERPAYQGYMAVKAILEYLLYNKKGEVMNFTPVDIVFNENIDFYTDAYQVAGVRK